MTELGAAGLAGNSPWAQAFPRNCWYVAAAGCEVGRDILARKINGERMVLYRKEDGVVVALRDACPHKGFPLSQSTLIGDEIRCNYHGIQFSGDGRCTNIPSQPTIPAAMRCQTFPVVEKWLLVWVWIGDADCADPSSIPDYGFEDQPYADTQFIFSGTVACNAQFLIDNLLDLTHLSFLHKGEFDTDSDESEGGEMAKAPLQVERMGNVVRAWRDMPGFVCNEPGIATMLGVPLGTETHRLTDTRVVPTSGYVIGRSLFTEPGDHGKVLADTVTAAIVTPVDPGHSLHTVLWCSSYPQSDALKESVVRVVGQDLAVLPLIQEYYSSNPEALEVTIGPDKAAILSRRMVAEAVAGQ